MIYTALFATLGKR